MAAREKSVKRYVVRLSAEEREQRLDSQRKKSGATAAEGAHFVEGGYLGSWRWVERQQDHCGPGDQRLHDLPGSQAVGGRRPRRGVEPQKAGDAGGSADLRRREGSQADCPGVLQAAQGTGALELAVVGKQGGGTQHR